MPPPINCGREGPADPYMPGHAAVQLAWMHVSRAHALVFAVLSGAPTPAQAEAPPSKSEAASEDPSRAAPAPVA
jgi:hypothetical protein